MIIVMLIIIIATTTKTTTNNNNKKIITSVSLTFFMVSLKLRDIIIYGIINTEKSD